MYIYMSTQSYKKCILWAATFLVLFYTPRVHLNKPYGKPMPPRSVTQLVLKLTGAKEQTNQVGFSMNFNRLLFV